MQILISHVRFGYDGAPDLVFDDFSAALDTNWRLGLIGRNGRGKTTLLRLLQGGYAYSGSITLPVEPVYFPYQVTDDTRSAHEVCEAGAPESETWQLEREMRLLRLSPDVLERPWHTLSHGEQTKVQLAALFARDDAWPMIDEPTNHLDAFGRAQVAEYLRGKNGFLLVSHDRAFLNGCIDHVLSINRADVWVMQGNYDAWQERYDRQMTYEAGRAETLRRDIRRLDESARQAAAWASRAEKGKFHVAESECAALDRGFVGARAAAAMKRAKNTAKRREKAAEEKHSLLQNAEQVGELRLTTLPHPKKELVRIHHGEVRYGTRVVAKDLELVLCQGERVALRGPNGCGKSSVLRAICGEGQALHGEVQLAAGLTVSYMPQEVSHLTGSMRAFIQAQQLDETLFKAILRLCGFSREEFEHPLDGLSQGQRKKLLLAASLCKPAHLYVWDEPLNYLDVLSRVQIEKLIMQSNPTMLLVEHDAMFVERVCSRVIDMK